MTDLNMVNEIPGQETAQIFKDSNKYRFNKYVLVDVPNIEAAQVKAHEKFGYRSQVQAYEVLEDTKVATSVVKANPHLGDGGAIQYFVEDYSTVLKAVGKPIDLL